MQWSKEALLKSFAIKKGDLTSINDKLFTAKEIKTLLKWKKVKPKGTKKADLVEAYIAAAKPPIQKSWTCSEEAALQDLKSEHVDLKDMALGIATTQMACAVANNLAQLDPESRDVLIKSLQAYDQDNGPNVLCVVRAIIVTNNPALAHRVCHCRCCFARCDSNCFGSRFSH